MKHSDSISPLSEKPPTRKRVKFTPLPSQRRLLELFDYDPEKGIITYRARQRPDGQGFDERYPEGAKATSYREKVYYNSIHIEGKTYHATRVIWRMMTGEDPKEFEIDHINGEFWNDKWSNLRKVTHSQNNKNRAPYNKTLQEIQ